MTRPLPWYSRAAQKLRCSLKLRLVMVFLLLAMTMSFTFISGAKNAFSVGWREAARPLLLDYVTRLAAEVAPEGTPSVERAQALTQRLPVTIDIAGPKIQWRSHPEQERSHWRRDRSREQPADPDDAGWGDDAEWLELLVRKTADGHRIEFGVNEAVFDRRPKLVGYTLAALLILTLLAFLYVRRLLRPLDDIRQGALRFGAGEFQQPIPVRHPERPDELGELATTINTMGQDIHQMLEAQRALLLAISHELRSPLTRARLNVELLDESPGQQAVVKELGQMRDMIESLLERERLDAGHSALRLDDCTWPELVTELVQRRFAEPLQAGLLTVDIAPDAPAMRLDRSRIQVLLGNLLDNALRHNDEVNGPVQLAIAPAPDQAGQGGGAAVRISVRDRGPGVPDDVLGQLGQPFFRPDSARTRHSGGVGLGLNLCRLIAVAHGGVLHLRNAQPGLEAQVDLPLAQLPGH